MTNEVQPPRMARLEELPGVRFPVADDAAPTRQVWMCVEQTPYGVAVTIHREDPGDGPSVDAGMAQVLVDYFDDRLALQIWDGDEGPRGDFHWRTPWGQEVRDEPPDGAAIVLVPRVADWHLPLPEQADEQASEHGSDDTGGRRAEP